ncbi:helix-turn-helix transcriptional regulator [Streptomyces chartreusis]|uniref:helix-turn-helix transcriptional regulator n=1 Tax=Streptomyces chartreusis TaxID=1969 RepID=UPI003801D49B
MLGDEFGLLEREAESGSILEGVKRAASGSGSLLLLEGPAGVGKTRLLREARNAASSLGFTVCRARASDLERDLTFGVVRQLFEPMLMAAERALWQGPAALAKEFLAGTPSTVATTGDSAILHSLYWLASNASQGSSLALLVDDLQWCDAPSLRYFAYLLPRLDDMNVLVVTALRTGEPAADDRLLQQIAVDSATTVLRPQTLSMTGTRLLLERVLPPSVDLTFVEACHQASGGNPLLLRELARTLTAEGIAASAENADKVVELGSHAVARLVHSRMASLPDAAVQLARAAAVLGDRVEFSTATALVEQDTQTALEGLAVLERVEILRIRQNDARMLLSFVHPLVRMAVYDTLNTAELAIAHSRAAQLLAAAGADSERIAAHLLRMPPAGNRNNVETLRAAAAAATARGVATSAYTYLRRALDETPEDGEQLPLLIDAGQAALLVDLKAAAHHLQQACDRVSDPARKADIMALLGAAYMHQLDFDRGIAVWSQALDQLPTADENRRRRLLAAIVATTSWAAPRHGIVLDSLSQLRELPPHDSIGARLLDCAIAGREMQLGDPAAIPRARHVLADAEFVAQAADELSHELALSVVLSIPLAADDPRAMEFIDTTLERAQRSGPLHMVGQLYAVRSLGWLWQGRLGEAEHDACESQRISSLTGSQSNQFMNSAYLGEVLAERGRLDEAEKALRAAESITIDDSSASPMYMTFSAFARLQFLRGDHHGALRAALQAQQSCELHGIRNPAVVGWRSMAALALHALDRADEALEFANQDLHLAQRWGAQRSLGRALRIKGLLERGDQQLNLLRQAVTVLDDSPPRLELAKALADLGAALRRAGHRAEARPPLKKALDLATICGAAPLAETARTELVAAGGRPRTAVTGPDALTPSERRVAELAATGATNRQIAQQLYVTPKTIEVHLSSAYRKLGISARTELIRSLVS